MQGAPLGPAQPSPVASRAATPSVGWARFWSPREPCSDTGEGQCLQLPRPRESRSIGLPALRPPRFVSKTSRGRRMPGCAVTLPWPVSGFPAWLAPTQPDYSQCPPTCPPVTRAGGCGGPAPARGLQLPWKPGGLGKAGLRQRPSARLHVQSQVSPTPGKVQGEATLPSSEPRGRPPRLLLEQLHLPPRPCQQ